MLFLNTYANLGKNKALSHRLVKVQMQEYLKESCPIRGSWHSQIYIERIMKSMKNIKTSLNFHLTGKGDLKFQAWERLCGDLNVSPTTIICNLVFYFEAPVVWKDETAFQTRLFLRLQLFEKMRQPFQTCLFLNVRLSKWWWCLAHLLKQLWISILYEGQKLMSLPLGIKCLATCTLDSPITHMPLFFYLSSHRAFVLSNYWKRM